MQYIRVALSVAPGDAMDLMLARLAAEGYEGFEETGEELIAYIPEEDFNQELLNQATEDAGINYSTSLIPEQNWNAVWESNFDPVIVEGFCTIRADFHNINVATPYEILITPKMSFGTGHHATTQLMMQMMKDIDFKGKSVLDFGTGTGVLAILASLLGAKEVAAIDNDPWSVENALENMTRNHCQNISVQAGSLDDTEFPAPGIILANINRNILLHYMDLLYQKLSSGGLLLMSGLLPDDKDAITASALKAGFTFVDFREQKNWIALEFNKA